MSEFLDLSGITFRFVARLSGQKKSIFPAQKKKHLKMSRRREPIFKIEKITNPETNRKITVNGNVYNDLLLEGYIRSGDSLVKPELKSEVTKTRFEKLPPEILSKILKTWPIKEVIDLCNTDKVLDKLVCQQTSFWNKRLKDDFKEIPQPGVTAKQNYLRRWRFRNANQDLMKALNGYLSYFKFLDDNGKLSIYDKVIQYFDVLYEKNQRIKIGDLRLDATGRQKLKAGKDVDVDILTTATRVSAYVYGLLRKIKNFRALVEDYRGQIKEDANEDFIYLRANSSGSLYDFTYGGYIFKGVIIPWVVDLCQKILLSSGLIPTASEIFLAVGEEREMEGFDVDKFARFATDVFKSYLEYKIG